jgi:predicted Rdx family selenoprotein
VSPEPSFLTPPLSHQYAQELLSTFSTTLGEVSLIPATGGTFIITLHHRPPHVPPETDPSSQPDLSTSLSPSSFPDTRYLPRPPTTTIVLWDRKTEGGFPETKELKNRVRNVIDPGRDLGHVDRSLKKAAAGAGAAVNAEPGPEAPQAVPSIESAGGGVATSTTSTVQGDIVMSNTTQPNPTEKCQDCH